MDGGNARLTLGLKVRGQKGASRVSQGHGTISTLGFGSGEGSLAVIVDQVRGLTAGASETLDLYDGSLLDVHEDPAEFRVLREYAVWVVSGGDTDGLTIGQAGANPHPLFWIGTTPGKTIYPGGIGDAGTDPSGVAVTATVRNLKLTNNGAVALTYRIYLAGGHGMPGVAMGPLGLTYP